MKTQFQITVRKVDNGFTVQATSDTPGPSTNKVAKETSEVQTIISDIVAGMFKTESESAPK